MKLAKQWIYNRKYIKRLLIALIIIYPLAGAFLGLDLGDTGYHLYAYTNLLSHPEKINYTTYFSSVVGCLWNQIFGWMGLLGFNFLEVLLEWGLVWMVYRTFRKGLGELTVLAGSLFAVIAADVYLNIFNYHQFNVFLLTAILCLEHKGIMEGKKLCSLFAGVLYVLVVFSRVGSVIAIVTLGLYIYQAAMETLEDGASARSVWSNTGRHLLHFGAGMVLCSAVLVMGLIFTGKMDYFISNIFRLGGIASDNTTSYGFGNLLRSLIGDNLKVIASGLIFYGAVCLLVCAWNIGLKKCTGKMQKAVCILLGIFVGMIALYQMYFSYNVNPAENWPQMTTGQRFLLGVMYVTAFLCFLSHAFKTDRHSKGMALLVVEACMLVILTIAGSNTGTKHMVLAMWLLAPVCLYTGRRLFTAKGTAEEFTEKTGLSMHPFAWKGALAVALVMFFLKFGHMVYYTFNYDNVDRTKLTATVNNRRVRGILTTDREADALNGVLEVLGEYEKGKPLMVFGNSLLFYYMTERDAYGMPWVTQLSYSLEQYEKDLEEAEREYKEVYPLVVYCRTNYSYGFEEEDVEQNQQDITGNQFSGKKEYFLEFLEKHDYGIKYMNDYYAVIVPGFTKDMKGLENVIAGW